MNLHHIRERLRRRLAFFSTMGSTGGGGPQSTGAAAQSTGAASTGQAMGSTAGSQQGSTGMGGGGSTVTSSAGSTASFTWGEGWRDAMAGGDAKVLARLGRFNSPEDMWRSYVALEQRMSSGELKSALKPDATDAEKAQWRKENGIPEKHTDYDLTLADGTVVGAEDRPVVDKFLEVAHAQGLPPAAVKGVLSWYYKSAEEQTEALAANDKRVAQQTQDVLRAKWGNDYRGNINALNGLLAGGPQGLSDQLLNGRMSDGTPIGSHPAALEFFAHLAKQLNPMGTVTPGLHGELAGQAVADEIAKLEGMMGNRNSAYWKGDAAQKNQDRYKELVAARDRQAAAKK